jgi:predicted aspartyl protease
MKTFSLLITLVAAAVLFSIRDGQTSDFNARIPMHDKGYATYYVSGALNDTATRDFLVDTGSGYVAINRQTLKELEGGENITFVKEISAVMADGSETVVPIYRIARLKLGANCTIEDVEAAVMPGHTPNILGLSALKKAAPFAMSVDPPTLTLTSCST